MRRAGLMVVGVGIVLVVAFLWPGSNDAAASFRSQADAICTDAQIALGRLPPASDQDSIVTTIRRSAEVNEDAERRLRALTPPPGDEATVDALLAAIGRANAAQRAFATAAERGDLPGVTAATAAIRDAQASFRSYADRLGLDTCRDATPSPSPSAS